MSKQNAYNREELLQCSRGELFGPGNAQLPAPNMLMIDRITHISDTGGKYGKGEIVAELDIHPDLWFFACTTTQPVTKAVALECFPNPVPAAMRVSTGRPGPETPDVQAHET